MSLEKIFEAARAAKRPAFIPYLMAGDPDLSSTKEMVEALREAGADCIELGIPYGDPLADGPAIAAAGMRALRNGVTIESVLELARSAMLPVVLFGYYNPILQYGLEEFSKAAREAGVSGVIVPDLALEETAPLRACLDARTVAMPLLVAPSTSLERARLIANKASGFVYVVSRLGVTGTGKAPDFAPLRAQLAELRAVTSKPLAVGFGLSTNEHVREIVTHADGIIVGSALIEAYAGFKGEEAASRVASKLLAMRMVSQVSPLRRTMSAG